MDQNYVRNAFRHYVRLAGLDGTYEVSEESQHRTPRSLHRLTIHSLRHYTITRFSKQTNGDLVLTCRFARHSRPDTTMVYISTRKEELYKQIDSIFGLSQAASLKAKLGFGRKGLKS